MSPRTHYERRAPGARAASFATAAIPIAWQAAGGSFLANLLTRSRSSCECRCVFEAAGEPGVLDLLRRQLDRCGPEHLAGAPAALCSGVSWTTLGVLLVLVALVAGGAGFFLGRRPLTEEPLALRESSDDFAQAQRQLRLSRLAAR